MSDADVAKPTRMMVNEAAKIFALAHDMTVDELYRVIMRLRAKRAYHRNYMRARRKNSPTKQR